MSSPKKINELSKRSPRYFTHYWTNETWTGSEDGEGDLIGWLYSTRFISRGVNTGDFIYPVTVFDGELYLLAKMEVEAVYDSEAAQEHLGLDPDELPGTEDIAVPCRSTPMNFYRRVPLETTRELIFVSGNQESSLVFRPAGGLDQQTLRGVRELTRSAAELLDQLLPPLQGYDETEDTEVEEADVEIEGLQQTVVKANLENDAKLLNGYRQAAEQGEANAQYNLGLCYYKGIGVGQDETEALKWFRKAANQGDADAQCHLGICHEESTGVDQDEAKAVKWYLKAANQGNADAQYRLGLCYGFGTGIDEDEEAAAKWYRLAAVQGQAEAQRELGVCYGNGTGVESDDDEMARWTRKAAEQGDALAQYNLGFCYGKGTGVPENIIEATRWWNKSAEQGTSCAQLMLGFCYEEGIGVVKNKALALKWFRLASAQGEKEAKKALRRLEKK